MTVSNHALKYNWSTNSLWSNILGLIMKLIKAFFLLTITWFLYWYEEEKDIRVAQSSSLVVTKFNFCM